MATVLETHQLRKRYGEVVALRGLDLQVQRGEVFGFLGPNGAGKTTFTKCVTGFVRPTAGEVRIMGEDAVRHPVKAAPHIGLVPDQYDFYPNLTGRQHLDFYGRLAGMDRRTRKQRIDDVLAVVRMDERADSRVKGYSHGMKQRICIAQAILHEPELILFDEPTNGLDPKGAYELRELIKGLAKDGTTIFLNSHQLPEVEQVCQRVAILQKGSLRAIGGVKDLQRKFGGNRTEIRVLNPSAKLKEAVSKAGIPATASPGGLLEVGGDDASVATAVDAIVRAGGRVVAVTRPEASLEEAFLALTDDAEVKV